MKNGESTEKRASRTVIINIWHRARINAFAHKVASEESANKAKLTFLSGLVSAVLSILFVILVYLMNNSTDGRAAQKLTSLLKFDHEITALVFALLSIIMSLLSIVLSVLASTEKYDSLAAEHRFLCNSYQYIAQRAREANWPHKPAGEILELLRDLERDFQLLKARGREPNDACFEKATEVFKKIRDDQDSHLAQSFRQEEQGNAHN